MVVFSTEQENQRPALSEELLKKIHDEGYKIIFKQLPVDDISESVRSMGRWTTSQDVDGSESRGDNPQPFESNSTGKLRHFLITH